MALDGREILTVSPRASYGEHSLKPVDESCTLTAARATTAGAQGNNKKKQFVLFSLLARPVYLPCCSRFDVIEML